MVKPEISAFTCDCSNHPQYNQRNEFVAAALQEAVSVYCGVNGLCPKAARVVMAKLTARMVGNIDRSERKACEEHFILLLESEFAGVQ